VSEGESNWKRKVALEKDTKQREGGKIEGGKIEGESKEE